MDSISAHCKNIISNPKTEQVQTIYSLTSLTTHTQNNDSVYSTPSTLPTNKTLRSPTGFTPRQYSQRPGEPLETLTLINRETSPNRMKMKVPKIFNNRSAVVDILAIFFGIGTWVGVNGTFIQLPLLVEVLPEGWSLPSYLSIMVQIGNLGPLAYTLIQKFSKTTDGSMIYGLLTTGTISAILTSFLYNKTATIFGSEHSVALFALTISTSLTACTSSVLFMPYMGRFKEIYLVTYFIGEGLSGLLPSVVALIQGIGGPPECILRNTTNTEESLYEKYLPPPRFGSQTYFILIFVMMLLSFVGFTLLDRLKISKSQYAAVKVGKGNDYVYERKTDVNDSTTDDNHNSMNSDLAPEVSSKVYVMLLFLICIISFFANGIFNSIQSYSCRPYGGQAYHLSATLSAIANPLACFLAIFLPRTSLRSIIILSAVASILTVYVFVTAIMSPFPPLYNTTTGTVLVILTWTLLVGLVSFIKLSITTVMRSQGGKSLVWTGGLTQLGSLIGSVIIFILINVTKSFTDAVDKC